MRTMDSDDNYKSAATGVTLHSSQTASWFLFPALGVACLCALILYRDDHEASCIPQSEPTISICDLDDLCITSTSQPCVRLAQLLTPHLLLHVLQSRRQVLQLA